MLCNKCNTNNDDSSRFCINCELELKKSYQDQNIDFVLISPQAEKRKKETNKKEIIAGYLILTIAIVVVSYIIYLSFVSK